MSLRVVASPWQSALPWKMPAKHWHRYGIENHLGLSASDATLFSEHVWHGTVKRLQHNVAILAATLSRVGRVWFLFAGTKCPDATHACGGMTHQRKQWTPAVHVPRPSSLVNTLPRHGEGQRGASR